MSTVENKARVRRLYEEIFNAKNLALVDELFSPQLVDHNASPGRTGDLAGFKELLRSIFPAFPDLIVTVEELVAEEEMVAARVTVRGTHRGNFMGVHPSDKRIVFSGIDIFRLSDGKIIDRWGVFDELGMMHQLGAIKLPRQG